MGSARAGKAANWSQLLLQSGLAWGLEKNSGGMVLTETGSPQEAEGEQTGKSQPALPPPARRRPLAPPWAELTQRQPAKPSVSAECQLRPSADTVT